MRNQLTMVPSGLVSKTTGTTLVTSCGVLSKMDIFCHLMMPLVLLTQLLSILLNLVNT
jgi:hypothetical protein